MAAAYIARGKVFDERLGQLCNFERLQSDLQHSKIIAPEGAPSWVFDREKLWNRAEAKKHVRYQPARTFMCALPRELSLEQQIELAHSYVRNTLVAQGRVADIAIHNDPDGNNPHLHIVSTTAHLLEDGFGTKLPCEGAQGWLKRSERVKDCYRVGWEEETNRALALAGFDVQISMRSFSEQGIDLEPTKHIGIPTKDVTKGTVRQPTGCERSARRYRDGLAIVADAAAEHEAILDANGDKILARPESALEAIARARGAFSRRDIASYLASHMDGERAALALEKAVNCGEAIFLGRDHEGNDRYTTKSYMRMESETLDFAVKLAVRNKHLVSAHATQGPSFERRMGPEQEAAYRYLTQESGDIAVVQGYAGSGKTYMLGAAREAWEAQGYRVVGAALAAKAAQGLENDAGIKSQTIASLVKSLELDAKHKPHGAPRYGHKTILVVDEAGMIGTQDLHKLLLHAQHRGMKVALIGDTAQLQAVGAGAMMKAVAERVGEVVVSEIRRQSVAWQREATRAMGRGDAKEALETYEQKGHFAKHETKTQAIESMVVAWAESRLKEPEKSSIMLAHERADVALANAKAREALIAAGKLKDGIEYKTAHGKRSFAEGDRLVFLKNDKALSVKNGQSGTVKDVGDDALVVRLDGSDAREVKIDVSLYGHFDHGYAVTVHKSQGDTHDKVFVVASAAYDAHVSYVALSRHKEDVRLYWSEDVFGSVGGLIERLSSASRRNNALDYAAAHPLDAAVLGELRLDRLDAAVAEQRQREFLLEIGALSNEELAERMSALALGAKGEVVKPSALEHEGGRLKELSEALEKAQKAWEQAAAGFDEKKRDFARRHEGYESEQRAEAMWQMHGPQTREGRDAQREMRRAFDAREAVISQMQRYHAGSKTAQLAVEQAREQNHKLRLSRERLHLAERETEQRRTDVLQRELDATEFNLQQRTRMWHEAAKASSQADVLRAYTRDGPLEHVWAALRQEQKAASNTRYELSGIVATRGAWFSPIEAELPTDGRGLAIAVDEARDAYQKAVQSWGLWRAEHSVAEAHAARRGEGEGATVYRDWAVADRAHGRAQRSYLELAAFDELDRAESVYLDAAVAWRSYKAAHREEAREAYKGKGEAGELWRAERAAQQLCARWESTYDWLAGRGRHHIFPQSDDAGTWMHLVKSDEQALQLAEQWEQFKDEHSAGEVKQARRGEGEGGELYAQLRVATAERQHARREFRIAKTEESLAHLERCSTLADRELTERLTDDKAIERAIFENGAEGLSWRVQEAIDSERHRLERQLDKLLRLEQIGLASHSVYKPTEAELADREQLQRKWLDAEAALAEKAAAWNKTPAQERRRARTGFGEHADTYAAYREALSLRDGLREPCVLDVREQLLSRAEREHFDAVLDTRRHAAAEYAKTETTANHVRRYAQGLFDKGAGWPQPLLHPQPEPTDERERIVDNDFYSASAGWHYWKENHSAAEVMRARLGYSSDAGAAMYDAYRRVDFERQHIREVRTHTDAREREHKQERARTQRLEAALERLLGEVKAREALEPEAAASLEKSAERKQPHSDARELPDGATILYVPYEQRDEAKAHGARWHKATKTWYAPDGADMAPLGQWRRNDALQQQRPRQSFSEVLREAGLVVDGEPVMDGQWHRVPVDGSQRKRDGAYIGNIGVDGRPYGYCKNHRTGDERRWSDTGGKPLTTEQRTQIVEQKKENAIERDLQQMARGHELKEVWDKLPEASNEHPYLTKKGVESHGLRQSEDGSLVMPLCDSDGDMWSSQSISAEGDKRLASGARKTGHYHHMGELEEASRILICEGYATGASLHRATGLPVVVAVDAGNLKPVAEAIRKRCPEAQIAIMADNDHHREVNVGVQKATAAAKAVDGVAFAPKLTDGEKAQKLTDFNDIEQARGASNIKSLNAEIDTRFKQVADERETKLRQESRERSRAEMSSPQQDSASRHLDRDNAGKTVDGMEPKQAKPATRERSAAEHAQETKERAAKELQRVMDEYGPKTKSKGRKGPGRGLSM